MTLLKKFSIVTEVQIGQGNQAPFPYFIDLMSASVDVTVAEECATILSSYIRKSTLHKPPFDIIVGLKQGSPQIASQLGNMLRRPVAIFRGHDEYKHTPGSKRTDLLFDGAISSGNRVLVVDDSTTGGRKVLDCVNAVRELNAIAETCLVLFEPLGKGSRQLLKENGIELHAVVRMDRTNQTKLGVKKPTEEA
jgi:orotate phosphoribosyltransferase